MVELFREFFWIIFPVLGMGVGAFAIWNEFSRQKKALEVLKIYAEKGAEPPESVVAVLNRSATPGGGQQAAAARSPGEHWARMAFFAVMAVGFGGLAAWWGQGDVRVTWPFTTGFAIAGFVLAAKAVQALVLARAAPRSDGQ